MRRIVVASSIAISVWSVAFAADGFKKDADQPIDLQRHTPTFQWRFHLKGRYRIRARVKTENVTGGARLAWQVGSPKGEPAYSAAIEGTADWTSLELETPDIGPARQAAIHFIQEGAGQSWFDDLEIVPIPNR